MAQSKSLVTRKGAQADKERELLLNRAKRFGLLKPSEGLDAILSLSIRDVLDRRLQTIVYKKQLSNSSKQARQFITHRHITVAGKVISSPAYLVPLSEEELVSFRETSELSNVDHPERSSKKVVSSPVVDSKATNEKVAKAE